MIPSCSAKSKGGVGGKMTQQWAVEDGVFAGFQVVVAVTRTEEP